MPQLLQDQAHRTNLIATILRLEDLPAIAQHTRVLSIEPGKTLVIPTPSISADKVPAPDLSRWQFGSSDQHRNGERKDSRFIESWTPGDEFT